MPAGAEFQVNTYTTGNQYIPRVAMDPAGDSVVTWVSFGQDGSGYGVYAQRYNAAGTAEGSEFRVNTYTAANQVFPSVAMDAAGDFVIAWASYNQDGSGYGIYAQRYNAAGVAQGGEFHVSTTTAGDQSFPTVAMDAAGDFVVAWDSNQGGSTYGIYAQRYNAAGAAQGSQFQVDTYNAANTTFPTIGMDTAGDFVIAWSADGEDGSGYGIYAQRYNAAGTAQGSEFRVNTYTKGDQIYPTVGMDGAGDFVVGWESDGQDGSGYGIYAQRYNPAGAAQGSEFQVNTYTTGDQQQPSLAIDAHGDFLISWESPHDGSGNGIDAQQFTAAGARVGGEFQVNTHTAGDQKQPSVALDANGDALIAWESDSAQDGSGYGIFAQRYTSQPTANVSITKAGQASGTVGTNLTYTITVSNAAGGAAAAGVIVTDTLPAGVTFVSATDPNGAITHSGSTVTDTLSGDLAAGSTDTLTLVATPGASTAGTTVTNSAKVTTTTTNVLGAPTTATASTAIAATPTLTIVKSAPATGTVGAALTYTVTVTNTGGAAATGATVTDVLPAGFTNITATDLAGTVVVTGNTVTDSLGSLAATTGVETLTITATPGASLRGQAVTNTATLTFDATTQTSSATTTIGGVAPPTGVGYLAGVSGDGTIQTFVQNVYRELLGREPDSSGEAFWLSYLSAHDNAAGRQQVIQAFMNSPEYAVHYITTAFNVILHRAPDAGGLAFWTDKMGQPGTPGQNTGSADEKYIIAALYGSDEFYLDSGSTPQGWINALYEDLLGRAADGGGLTFWSNELKTRGSGDRDGIVRDLLTTPEVAHDLLDSFYPAAGGTASTPLATPGTTAGTGMTELALLTGGGWENLYLEGAYGSSPQGNDGFFNSLVAGGNWDDIQLLMLETPQFYSNPNRPVTS
ncbi:MAG TPA: DUF4214 domain-containing protein [Pirellulales bacterium]|nr:DUF4214 domain-containing protein [Pirellulales bacterium]